MNSHGPNRHAWVRIDLEAIRHNYRLLKKISGDNRLIAVVKADAYGHGAIEVANALSNADAFAVAAVGEALALRKAGIEQKIIVLGGFIRTRELDTCVEYQLDPVIHQQIHLDQLVKHASLKGLQVWVKVDTGMGRLGYAPAAVPGVLEQLGQVATLGPVRMMTHLACADDLENSLTKRQLERVDTLELDDYEWGIANSSGILGWPISHRLWVRAGIALYGANPMTNRIQARVDLKPAMQMIASILAVNDRSKGDLIGYGGKYACSKDMKIAVIAAGYADGYPRHKIDTARVNIHGQPCDIVGSISMDMITVDVSLLEA
ncbi:MAG: alanine racemase, partial [Gammaproteobacteria bacterium]|nr:alanine racemase [Gammaproteobacteria bacterium]